MAKCADVCGVTLAQKRVVLQKPNPNAQPDENGHVDYALESNWTTVKTVWGTPKSRGGRESYLFNQVQAEITSMWDFRYSEVTKQIQPTWRIVFGGRKIEISAAFDVDEAKQTIRCMCVERK